MAYNLFNIQEKIQEKLYEKVKFPWNKINKISWGIVVSHIFQINWGVIMLRALVKERQLFRNILKPGFTFIYLHVHKIYQVYCILYVRKY